jgi:hypothetical protein
VNAAEDPTDGQNHGQNQPDPSDGQNHGQNQPDGSAA